MTNSPSKARDSHTFLAPCGVGKKRKGGKEGGRDGKMRGGTTVSHPLDSFIHASPTRNRPQPPTLPPSLPPSPTYRKLLGRLDLVSAGAQGVETTSVLKGGREGGRKGGRA